MPTLTPKSPFTETWGKGGRNGRPRKPGERWSNGRLKHVVHVEPLDVGTEELRRHRREAAVGLVGADDPRTESVLGRLWIIGKLSEQEYDAGKRYAEMHFRVWRPSGGQSVIGQLVAGDLVGMRAPTPDETADDRTWKAELERANAVLEDDRWLVLDVVIYGEDPQPGHVGQLKFALHNLYKHFTREKRVKSQERNSGQSEPLLVNR